MKIKITILLFLSSIISNAQSVTIPDNNFRAKLLAASPSNTTARNLGNIYFKIDANNDGVIQVSEALQVSWLDVSNANILNLQGIAAFTALKYLNCNSNYIGNIELSPLTLLEELRCGGNELNNLDVSANTSLMVLTCSENHLTTLDVNTLSNLEVIECTGNDLTDLTLGNLDNLVYLTCGDNELTSIDASNFNNLKYVSCPFNNLTSLNVSGSTQIEDLRCNSNNLNSIDVTSLTNLHVLDVSVNNLTEINLSNQILLEILWCIYNDLSTIDVSSCMFLDFLDLRFNEPMTSIYMKNGSNETLQLAVNTSLTFICCDENEFSYVQNLSGVSGTQIIVSTDCLLNTDKITAINSLFYPNPVQDKLYFSSGFDVDRIEVYDLDGRILLSQPVSNENIDLCHFQAGIYLIKMQSKDRSISKKFIKK